MAIAISLFVAQVKVWAKIPANRSEITDPDDYEANIKAAVEQFARDKPWTTTKDTAGDGGRYYALSSTTYPGWDDGVSFISEIEYPVPAIDSEELPSVLDENSWQIYEADEADTISKFILFTGVVPASGDDFRVRYNRVYTWTAVDDEAVAIEQNWFYAICHLAASYMLKTVAALYASDDELGTYSADSVAWGSKSRDWLKLAEEQEKLYDSATGKGDTKTSPAMVIGDMDIKNPAPHDPYDYVFHPQNRR
jgi:hypothetical protein